MQKLRVVSLFNENLQEMQKQSCTSNKKAVLQKSNCTSKQLFLKLYLSVITEGTLGDQ